MASTQPQVQMLGLELPRSAFCLSYGEHSTSSIDAGHGTPQLEALCILWRALNLQYRCWGQNSLEALSVYLMASTQPLVQILGLKLRRSAFCIFYGEHSTSSKDAGVRTTQKRFLYILWRALNLQYRCWGQNSLSRSSLYLLASPQPQVQMLGLDLPRSAFCISYGEHSTSSIDAGLETPQLEALCILWRALNLQYRCWGQNSIEALCMSYGEHSTSSIDAGVGTPQLEALCISYGEHSTSNIDAGVRTPQKRFLYILWRALNLQYRCWGQKSLEALSVYLMASTQPLVQMLGL